MKKNDDQRESAEASAHSSPRKTELALFPPFRPRFPWMGADLQTLRNKLRPSLQKLPAHNQQRMYFPLTDGSDDRLAAMLHAPSGTTEAPLVIVIHGLSGTEDSVYVLNTTASLLHRGYRVMRLNLRGAGASRPLCRLQYHAGRTEDLRDVLAAIEPHLLTQGLYLVGFSLGGNMLLKFLAEYASAFPIIAAASVSAPIDLAAAVHRILEPRNRIYHRYLLTNMKEESLATPGLSPNEARRIREARNIYEFDDLFVAPRNQYRDANAYYEANSAQGFLSGIKVPTLVIHALDDPWIPPDAYRDYNWTQNSQLLPLLVAKGGHVGFHGRNRAEGWHDQSIALFFQQES